MLVDTPDNIHQNLHKHFSRCHRAFVHIQHNVWLLPSSASSLQLISRDLCTSTLSVCVLSEHPSSEHSYHSTNTVSFSFSHSLSVTHTQDAAKRSKVNHVLSSVAPPSLLSVLLLSNGPVSFWLCLAVRKGRISVPILILQYSLSVGSKYTVLSLDIVVLSVSISGVFFFL